MRGRPLLPLARLPLLPLLLLLGGPLPRAPAPAAGCPGAPLPHRALLDAEGQYWLRWGPRGARLAFRLEARTAGYLGLGFSPSGSMAAADLVLGGVAHGRPYLQVSRSDPAPSAPAGRPAGRPPGRPAWEPAEGAGRRAPRVLPGCSPRPPQSGPPQSWL